MSFWIPVDRDSVLKEGWEADATYQWGIPLHPLGELDAISFVTQAQGDLEDMRIRQRNIITQTFFNVLATYVFLRNILISVQVLKRRNRMLAGWCCLLQALAGLAYTLCCLLAGMPNGPSCRHALWAAGFGMSLSSICVGATLLQKAYFAHNSNKWLLAVGTVLLLPQPLVAYYIWTSPAAMVPTAGCLLFYPPVLPWIKLALDAPINIIFSIAFLAVVYRQYRQFGSAAWARLVSDGIRTMGIVVLSNTICMLCIVFEVAGVFSEFFFVYDWVITSILLGNHISGLRNIRSTPNAPQTAFVLQGFSQIETAQSRHLEKSPVEEAQPKQHEYN